MEKYITQSKEETQKLGEDLARQILAKNFGKTAVVLGLRGDLGAGKTTFLQGFAKGLGIQENVLSPTFIVMKRFGLGDKYFKNFYHIDCYRLNSEQEILHLGFKEIIADPQNIVAIEWPENILKILSKNIISIAFEHLEKDTRKIHMGNL